MNQFSNLTITKARELLDNKEISAVELTQYYLNQIKSKNKDLNAFLSVSESALDQAKKSDEEIKNGSAGSLVGIPLAIKDKYSGQRLNLHRRFQNFRKI